MSGPLGVLTGLRQFLAYENPLKMMKNAFLFDLKKLFSFFRCLSFRPKFSGSARKRLIKKFKVNFKFHDVIYWETNDYNTHIAQYL